MDQYIYELDNGMLWDTRQARYIEQAPAPDFVQKLRSAEGQSDEAYLIETLKFYGLPLGDLSD